ncbi:MAG: molybdopterin molybdenumtransferase MoeA, partial [Acidimicrobiia bacterium]|nr:molybdopterin molybdenumtransferase MoeA [Acidimicrobiia bacterium]
MIPLEEARAFVLHRCPPPVPADVDLRSALGLVLAEPVEAVESVPPF